MSSIETEPSLFASLWRYKWYIAAAAVLASVVGFGVSLAQSTVYETQGDVLLKDPRNTATFSKEVGLSPDPKRHVRDQAQLLESAAVAARASELLGGSPSASAVEGSTSATPSTTNDAVAIHGSGSSGEGAVAVVNALEQAYEQIVEEGIQNEVDASIAVLEQSRADLQTDFEATQAALAGDSDNVDLTTQQTELLAQIAVLDTRIQTLTVNTELYGSGVKTYLEPSTPGAPTQPKPARNALIAAVLGLIGAGAWAWWRAESDHRVDNADSPAVLLDAPLLGAVRLGQETESTREHGLAASAVALALEQVDGRTAIVTATSPGDAAAQTAVDLATAAADDGWSPLLIDADLNDRYLTQLAGLETEAGLTDLHDGKGAKQVVHQWTADDRATIAVIPAGDDKDDMRGYFRTTAFSDALASITADYDFVLIDTPPVISSTETSDLATLADGVVVIVTPGVPHQDLNATAHRLAMTGAPILGYLYVETKNKPNRLARFTT